MAFVHLLIGQTAYEGSTVLRAFADAGEARRCHQACFAHEAKRPRYPDRVEDTPENDAAFDKAQAATKRWERRHPGGPAAATYADFIVQRLRLHASKGGR